MKKKNTKGEWPQSLKEYVQRCYCSCRSDDEKNKMDLLLKNLLVASIKSETFHSQNWERVPILEIEQKPKIVGTSTEIEKTYLRSTSEPEPSKIRPKEILVLALENAKRRWIESRDYNFYNSQMKAIRQDMKIQQIEDFFAVHVYETNSRTALEVGDIGEFNQCQNQLFHLYETLKIETDSHRPEFRAGFPFEFQAYNILYQTFINNLLNSKENIRSLNSNSKKSEIVKYAIKIHDAVSENDYVSFFKLYKRAPKMCAYILDLFVERERLKAMKIICSSYRPFVSVRFLKRVLAFGSSTEIIEWMGKCQVHPFEGSPNGGFDSLQIDPKTSFRSFSSLYDSYLGKIDIKGQL